jgi:predicted nucleotide-binding protein
VEVVDQLKLHLDTLVDVIDADKKFFVSVRNYVYQLRTVVNANRDTVTKEQLSLLSRRLDEFWDRWRPSGDGFYIPPAQARDSDDIVVEITRLIRCLVSLDDEQFCTAFPAETAAPVQGQTAPPPQARLARVFIGHGRSQLWARVQVFLQSELKLEVVTYEAESRVGKSIVSILEDLLAQATFAVLVLTAEDEVADGGKRARQNVVHEAGLFQGRLGFERAVLLKQEGVEEFTNVAGLQHIPFSGERIDQTFYELQRVLKREGLIT